MSHGYCEVGMKCRDCHLLAIGHHCSLKAKTEFYYCDQKTEKVLLNRRAYLECKKGVLQLGHCDQFEEFDVISQKCDTRLLSNNDEKMVRRLKRSGGSKTGDMCAFNTDCQSGMYCFNGVCTCLSDYVSIAGYCWPKVNPGDSGCVEDLQCEAVWPGSKCSRMGLCDCPENTAPSKTRDGTVCVSAGVPPSCPLPEPNNPEAPNPATILANPTTHPLAQDTYMPVLCTSTSTEIQHSNNGDGSSWCVYPDGDQDVYVADIYNCVPHPQVRPDYFPEYADTVDGICCHSRAFVCVQPMEQGEEPSIPRWWYNSVTGTCSQFLWDPSQSENVSPNNFRTIEHCESYCRDTCRRGPNQFNRHSRGSILDETPVTNCLHQTGSCGPEFHCTLIGSHQHCCPTIGHICSPHGGRGMSYLSRESFDPGVPIAGSRSVSRFYYDAEQGRCTNFIYDGLGNYNNFFTKQECESFCSKLVCEYGNPLRIGEDWQRCETNNDCPTSHQCESAHKVCCPTAQSICTQPKRLGDCTSSVRRYWYNAATRACELFQYTGCQGNDNNFDGLLDCQQKCRNVALEPKCPQGKAHRDTDGNFFKCSTKGDGKNCPPNFQCYFDGTAHGCCPTKAYTCSLSQDKGVQCGSGRSFRYYFNANKQTCESFQYEGCDGNSNNFQNVDDCQDYCGVGGCPNGGQPLRDMSNNQFVLCTDEGGCPATHECVAINFNGNVAHRCCSTKAQICSLPPQQGNLCTKQPVTRWYFNIVTKECAKFSYNGCNGNLNNFASLDQCTNFCSSSACAPGEITFKEVNTKQLMYCSPTLLDSCPADYKCRHDSLTTKHVCCGTPMSDFCPEGEKAYVNALDESVKECQINMAGSCPANYLCRFSTLHNRYYCCASRSGNMCPEGKALYRTPRTLQPALCTLNGPQNTCVEGFSCQSRVADVLQGHCCSAQNVCKNGAVFQIDEKTLMPKICMQGAFSACDEGYRCYKAANSANGYCCKGEGSVIAGGCPPGEYAFTKKDEIVQCDPFNLQDKGCPAKYSCQYALTFQRYQCCGKEPVEEEEIVTVENGCAVGQVAYIQNGALSPQLCTASAPNSCPVGFFCQFSDKNRQFQCCAHKAGCPADTVAFVDVSGNPQSCKMDKPTHTQCPIGYSCRETKDERTICCTLEGVDKFTTPAPNTSISITERPAEIVFIVSEKNGTVIRGKPEVESGEESEETEASGSETDESVSQVRNETKSKTTKCKANEVITPEGGCRARLIGEGCILPRQCPETSVCAEYTCKCPSGTTQKDNTCVKHGDVEGSDVSSKEGDEETKESVTKSNNRRIPATRTGSNIVTDKNRGLQEMLERIKANRRTPVLKCSPDEISFNGTCIRKRVPIGANCVITAQCGEGAKCIHKKCRCPTGKAGFNNKCWDNICGSDKFRLPQLSVAGNNAVKCGHSPELCKYPHRCSFSKRVHDYICCRSANSAIATITTGSIKINGSRNKKNRTIAISDGDSAAKSENCEIEEPKEESSKTTNNTQVVVIITPDDEKKTVAENVIEADRKKKNETEITGRPKHKPDYNKNNITAQRRRNGSAESTRRKAPHRDRRCMDGSKPLMFPRTSFPVKCVSVISCPTGYSCIRNMCCQNKYRPSSLVVLSTHNRNKANQFHPEWLPTSPLSGTPYTVIVDPAQRNRTRN